MLERRTFLQLSLGTAAYTCAGGPDWPTFGMIHGFKPAAYRRRLYDIILEQQPDLVVANGDHIYWDLGLSILVGQSERHPGALGAGIETDASGEKYLWQKVILPANSGHIVKRHLIPQTLPG